jgi:hypothetical protein
MLLFGASAVSIGVSYPIRCGTATPTGNESAFASGNQRGRVRCSCCSHTNRIS